MTETLMQRPEVVEHVTFASKFEERNFGSHKRTEKDSSFLGETKEHFP